ncbi:MAG TPA: heparan-alpha-glucosaminide N-acetyltransferase domain-containing protein, partial [Mucilaginibacter sp.]|nr:heparan-alpha-glucosaminide N-acetyltransferase domain-containing protein [Mucilaginibacter sp.]
MTAIIKNRITSIDFLRGTIMIIMALDHVRDYLFSGSFYFDPLDLSKTSWEIFFTRWITHFCMPIFMLLAGTSAYLIGRKKSKKELSAFLVKRGLWLVVLELIVVNFGWNFNITFPMFFFITIWALGVSMILLAGFIHLPIKWILTICIIIVAGHNLLDNIHVAGNTLPAFGWALLHDQRFFTWHKEIFLVGYPLIPLIAVMPLGYCLGTLYAADYDAKKRQKNLLILGGCAIAAFIILRYSNVYGDPVKWSVQKNALFTFLSFLNVNKYPPSLLYLLLTLGGACLFLSFTEKLKGAVVNVVSVYGRVPMFYYLVHIYVIHLIALTASALTSGQDWTIWFLKKPIWFTSDLKGYGFSLPVSYLVWIGIVVALYPLCKRYDAYKQANKQ